MSTEVRTYEIVTKDGTFRIDIPEAWKVTYGPVIGAKGYEHSGNAFRVWETDKQQRALFSDVVSFCDLTLPRKVKAVRYYGTDNEWLIDDGSYTGGKALLVERGWVDADTISNLPPVEIVERPRAMKPRY